MGAQFRSLVRNLHLRSSGSDTSCSWLELKTLWNRETDHMVPAVGLGLVNDAAGKRTLKPPKLRKRSKIVQSSWPICWRPEQSNGRLRTLGGPLGGGVRARSSGRGPRCERCQSNLLRMVDLVIISGRSRLLIAQDVQNLDGGVSQAPEITASYCFLLN